LGKQDMIAHFPNPYPEELFYSVCARFSDRLAIRGVMDTTAALFGNPYTPTEIEWPFNLSGLKARLPQCYSFEVDHILDTHTNLPLYAPFLSEERYKTVRRIIIAGEGSQISGLLCLNHYRGRNPTALKYCAECVVDDEKKWGETFWHRAHQAAGMIMCPVHRTVLHIARSFQTRRCYRKERYAFYAAEKECRNGRAITFSGSRQQKELLLQIAQDVDWLLRINQIRPRPEKLTEQYRIELVSRKLAAPVSHRVYHEALHRAFTTKYPPLLLRALGVRLELNMQHDWLMRLTHNRKSAQIPLHHILLIRFLGYSVQDFFGSIVPQHKTKTTAAYLCLNPLCKFFSKREIPKFRLKKNHPRAVFECPHCGYTYARHLPVTTDNECRPASIVDYGPQWMLALRSMWNNAEMTMTAIAKRLGVARGTVRMQAFRLNLRFPRIGMRTKKVPEKFSVQHDRRLRIELTRKKHRDGWTVLRREWPNRSRSQLAKSDPTAYDWLRRYDNAWLYSHQPPVCRKPKHLGRDWEALDLRLLKAVQQTGKLLLASFHSEFPRRITARRIALETRGFDSRFLNRMAKLPKTAAALSKVVNTRDSLAKRRTEWLRSQNFLPKGWSESVLKYRLGLWAKRSMAKKSKAILALIKAASDLIARSRLD
jgi:hypothetical protein